MADNETIEDILAELRERGECRERSPVVYDYADRLDAAHKREIEDAERRGNHAATKAICETIEKVGPLYDAESVGNAAKLREAIVEAKRIAESLDGCRLNDYLKLEEIARICNAALAAPARNCDVGTVKEQSQRFDSFCDAHKYVGNDGVNWCSRTCPCYNDINCGVNWAQLPCESEVAK